MSTAIVRKRRRAEITRKDVTAIARLVAKRLTEKEACEILRIRPRSWYQWKERHKNHAEYEALLTRVRGEYLRANLEQMERAAAGLGGVRHDWRAADRLNAICDPSRFGTQAQPQEPARPTDAPDPARLRALVAAVFDTTPEPAEIIDTQAKALPPIPAEEQPEPERVEAPKPVCVLPSYWRKKKTEPKRLPSSPMP